MEYIRGASRLEKKSAAERAGGGDVHCRVISGVIEWGLAGSADVLAYLHNQNPPNHLPANLKPANVNGQAGPYHSADSIFGIAPAVFKLGRGPTTRRSFGRCRLTRRRKQFGAASKTDARSPNIYAFGVTSAPDADRDRPVDPSRSNLSPFSIVKSRAVARVALPP